MDFWRFWAARHISRANCAKTGCDRHRKAALNVAFDDPSLIFLGSRKPVQSDIKQWYPRKSRYFTVVSQSFMKMVADHHGHAAYHNKH